MRRSALVSAVVLLLLGNLSLAGESPTTQPARLREELAPPMVNGYGDPNAIVYDGRRLQQLHALWGWEAGLRQRIACTLSILRLQVMTPAGPVVAQIGTCYPRLRYFYVPCRSQDLMRFVEGFASGQAPPGSSDQKGAAADELRSAYRNDVLDAIEILGSAKVKEAVPVLAALLNDETMRGPAMQALGNIGPDAAPAVPPLVQLLGDDAEASDPAADALGAIGAPAVPALVAALTDARHPKYGAIPALGRIGPGAKPAVPALLSILNAPHTSPPADLRRCRSAVALGGMGSAAADAVPDLIRAIDEPWANSLMGQNVAAHALCRIGPAAKSAIPHIAREIKEGDSDATLCAGLFQMGPEGRAAVIDATKDGPPYLRSAVVVGLQFVRPDTYREARHLLPFYLSDPDAEVRGAAMELVSARGPDDFAVPALVARLRDEDEQLRYKAMQYLRELASHQNVRLPLPEIRAALVGSEGDEQWQSTVRQFLQDVEENGRSQE